MPLVRSEFFLELQVIWRLKKTGTLEAVTPQKLWVHAKVYLFIYLFLCRPSTAAVSNWWHHRGICEARFIQQARETDAIVAQTERENHVCYTLFGTNMVNARMQFPKVLSFGKKTMWQEQRKTSLLTGRKGLSNQLQQNGSVTRDVLHRPLPPIVVYFGFSVLVVGAIRDRLKDCFGNGD